MAELNMVHPVPRARLIADRAQFIADICRGRRVLHLGCVQSGSLEEALAAGTLLHLRLSKVASELVGVDLDAQGIARMRKAGFTNLHHGDVEHLQALGLGGGFDVVVAGEIVEHLSNPGLCLDAVRGKLRPEGRFVVTVPNAFSFRHMLPLAFRRRELVMDDHTAYHSFQTMRALLTRHGFTPVEHYAASDTTSANGKGAAMAKRVLNASLLRVMPQVAEGLIVVARPATAGAAPR